jgi:hypothetical protein
MGSEQWKGADDVEVLRGGLEATMMFGTAVG